MVRLFGALQTRETRNEKIQQIDQRVAEEESKITESEESMKYDLRNSFVVFLWIPVVSNILLYVSYVINSSLYLRKY